MNAPNRRDFLETSGLATLAAAGLSLSTEISAGAPSGSERLDVALIGPGGMGSSHLALLVKNPAVRVAYVCEVDAERLATAVKTVETATGETPKAIKDMREAFDDKNVVAVWIATPDHWHAPATILACQAGKHVYVEKPCCHNIREGRLMIEAARTHQRVVQVGTQSRSTAHVARAMERLRSGAIGEVLVSKAWNSQRRGTIGHAEPSNPPAQLDYDLWLGPATFVPYQSNLLPGIWRWWHHFGAGDIGNDGVHDIDIARWGLGVETHPNRVAALGGKYFFEDDQQFPDTQYIAYEYAPATPGGKTRQLVFEMRIWSPYVQEGYENGNAYYGTEGMMILGKRGGYHIYGRRNQLVEKFEGGEPDLAAHHRNFLECIASGATPNADVETNHYSSALCHLGNIATRMGRVLQFDPAEEKIIGDEAAHKLVRREYRDHWATPKG